MNKKRAYNVLKENNFELYYEKEEIVETANSQKNSRITKVETLEQNSEIVKTRNLEKNSGEVIRTIPKLKKYRKQTRRLQLKQNLSIYYEPPKPQRKRTFIRQLGIPKINMLHLVAMQAKYISKWVWIISGIFCTLIYKMTDWTQSTIDLKYISIIIAVIPFFVMLSLTETMHSYRYKMDELELSTRFSLKSIVLARLLLLGVGNGVVLMFTGWILGNKTDVSMLYVITPYFLTTSGGLFIVRTVTGNENTFFCFLLAGVVSGFQVALPWQFHELFLPKYSLVWSMVCVIGIIITLKESYQTIRMTEELVWN